MAIYKIGNKEVTEEEFYKQLPKGCVGTVYLNEPNEEITIKQPFFLDEVVDNLPGHKTISDEELLKGLLKPHLIGGELRDEWQVKAKWDSSNTGGTVFEKVQDHTLSDYLSNTTVKFKILDLSDSNPLDAYNDIVGHSTRHKASSQGIQNDIQSQNPNKTKSLIEQYTEIRDKEELEALKKQLIDSDLFISLEDSTLIFTAKTKEELQPLIDRFNNIDSKVGVKETEGKLDYSEINFELLDLMAKRFMDNKVKYPKGNTLKEINKDDILWAAFRHIRKMIKPEKNDPETYEDHLAAIATNMSIILDQLERK